MQQCAIAKAGGVVVGEPAHQHRPQPYGAQVEREQQNGTVGVIYADQINGGRLSWYHRLDVSVKRHFKLTKKSNLDATFAITNVYDRQNIFYVDRITNVKVYQLPFFPSINLTWTF